MINENDGNKKLYIKISNISTKSMTGQFWWSGAWKQSGNLVAIWSLSDGKGALFIRR